MRALSIGLGILLFLMLGFLHLNQAQEFDSVILDENRKPFTIVDQMTDAAERESFLALLGQKNSRKRAALAEAFLVAYPRSAFLAQVYEIASKSYIDLGNYNRALRYAEDSLKLLPENPLLVVQVANVQLQQGLLAQAKRSAREALDYLERFSRPIAIPKQAWPQLKRQLKSSTYYVLGRAAAFEATGIPPGQRRVELLQQSVKLLKRARALNPADPEIAYLMGLSYLWLGKADEAARSFVAAYRRKGPTQSRALQELRRIYEASWGDPKISFESFLKNLEVDGQDFAPHSPSKSIGSMQKVSDYAGTGACRVCHIGQYKAWAQTGMARMFRPYRWENVIGDFEHDNQFYTGEEVRWEGDRLRVVAGGEKLLFARMLTDQKRHYFEIRRANGRWHRYPVDYTIGSKWQQAYATRLPNGQTHVFPIQYNALEKRWINFWKVIDPPKSERANVLVWENLSPDTSYEANCAVCHTSQLRNVKGGGFGPDNLKFREPGINCEMCHGPSGKHVAAMLRGESYLRRPLEPPVAFSKISSRDYIAICAQCHMQSAIRKSGRHGELNFSRQDGLFFRRLKSAPFIEFSRKAFYKDGRLRETSFIVESLLRSACFKKGQVNCGHCHDPHREDASTNINSLKFLDQPDQMCLQCHSSYTEKIESHTRHPAGSEASRCTSCHMPRIMRSLLFKAGTHRVDDIPDAEMTLRFGQEESPNACLLCHSDKDAQWVKEQLLARVESRQSN